MGQGFWSDEEFYRKVNLLYDKWLRINIGINFYGLIILNEKGYLTRK